MNPLKVAVVGLGRMGTNHARVLSEMPDVRLEAVCDVDNELARKTGRRYLAERACTDIDDLLASGGVDAAVIAVPTAEHVSMAMKCLQRGIHVLIEKPMAPTEEECDTVILEARAREKVLAIGHIERFNPVILKLREFLEERFLGDIYCVETSRSGPFPRRLYGSKDGVVIDLAVHDLDLIAHLFGPLRQLYANQILTADRHQDIHARILLKTRSGIVGSCQVSWISPRRERSISVYGDKGIIIGNLNEQELWYYENGDVDIDYSDNYFQNVMMGRVSEGKVIKFPVKKEEPLKSELASFCANIRDGERPDPVYGRDAVRYSLSVLRSAKNDAIEILA